MKETHSDMTTVILESPYAGKPQLHVRYARYARYAKGWDHERIIETPIRSPFNEKEFWG